MINKISFLYNFTDGGLEICIHAMRLLHVMECLIQNERLKMSISPY